jgi:redox-sensitive bicupin YhaK (pirin superfamily)
MAADLTPGVPGDIRTSTALEIVIAPRSSEIADGFTVRRALPSSRRRMVGPFIFLDQMGPELLLGDRSLDIAPHPHIGLATVTYLFEGEILHRDSTGIVQPIRAGDVNWMTAARGIAHSERTPDAVRAAGGRIFGLQSWVALPARDEEREPSFAHHDMRALPIVEGEGKRVRLVAGSLFGERSPVETLSELFYADALLDTDARIEMTAEHEERAAYIVEGAAEVEGEDGLYGDGQLLIFRPGVAATLRTARNEPARIMLLGGAALDGPRHIWWNFVSSSRERIEQAKEDWRAGRFAAVPGETERIPLPGSEPADVKYP